MSSSSSSSGSDAAAGSAPDAGSAAPDAGSATSGTPLGRMEPRLAMAFTCGKCDTRAVKTFSKRSYERGLVLVRCPGCDKLHLVADHLGWFGDKGFMIEQLAQEGVSVTKGTAGEGSSLNLSAEDIAGYSKVQQLVAELTSRLPANRRPGGSAGSQQQAAAAPAAGAADAPDVWELTSDDMEQWSKVHQAEARDK